MVSRNSAGGTTEELDTLKRIEVLVAAMARAALTAPLAEILGDAKLRLLYEKAGKIPRTELEKKTKFSGGKISGLWKQWESKGLMVKNGKSYRPIF